MDKLEIDRIVKELHTRTSWGVCLDLMELSDARRDAKNLIDLLDDAIIDIEEFVKESIKDPKTPKRKE